MPLFAFVCNACGAQSELLARADEKVVCPHCKSPRMERQMSRFAPVSGRTSDPACSGCAMGDSGSCPTRQHTGCSCC